MKIYAKIGTSTQTIISDGVPYTPQADEVEMSQERPEGEWVASPEGEWVKDTDKAIKALDRQYNSNKAILTEQHTEADMLEDFELKASIKVELATLQAEYDRAYEELVGGAE